MPDRLYDIEPFDGDDDYIPDEAMVTLGERLDRLPDEFDLGHTQGAPKSVTATIKFPVAGPAAQLEALDTVLLAACIARALHSNLTAARSKLAALESTG